MLGGWSDAGEASLGQMMEIDELEKLRQGWRCLSVMVT